jgi:predicted DNA-binding transcriptional regulator YafY
MSSEPDYRATNIPDTKPADEYTYVERRAEILQLIQEAGHPRAISQTRLADRYGVTQGQISQDIDRLQKFITESIDHQTVDGITEIVYQKSIKELMANDEYNKAIRAVESWNNWLMDRGKVEKEPDKHDMQGEGIVIDLGDE